MRVFCPEHGKGFFAPRRNPIKCENRGHPMGELDFEGASLAPVKTHWQYCCNCEHFFLLESAAGDFARCPACARQLFTRYVCDRCYLISCESNTPAQNKNFTLNREGLPQPTCPGCLQSPTNEVREHDCDELGAVFVTALTTCSLCEERLDVSPTFPALVSYYLKRTRKKVIVTFDYESELFFPAEDGEYVVVQNGSEPGHELMLPRTPSFSARREFYDHYQDSFYCSDPAAGEIEVVEPAVVDRVENGWVLNAHGVLKIVANPAKPRKKIVGSMNENVANPITSPKPIPADVSSQPGKTVASPARMIAEAPSKPANTVSAKPVADPGPPKRATSEDSSTVICSHCDSLIEAKYPFCWHCGNPTGSKPAPAKRQVRETTPLISPLVEEDEVTLPAESKVPATGAPSIFSWALEEQRPRPAKNNNSRFKLFTVVVGIFLFALVLFFVIQPSSSKVSSALPSSNTPTEGTVSQKPADETQPAASESSGPASRASKSAPAADTHAADLELVRIKSRRAGSAGPQRDKILRELKRAETTYPNDYRFPYERARLSINPEDKRTNDEAFNALTRAAEKAIEYGKADEMLASLSNDKDGDFNRLSRNRSEWRLVEQALRNKDMSRLHH